MINIRLFCAAGMSTSLLERKIRDAADEQGIEVTVSAYPASEIDQRLEGTDVALIGPQVQFMRKVLQAKCDAHGIPMDVIPMRDYGTVNGASVLKLALKLLEK